MTILIALAILLVATVYAAGLDRHTQ